MHQIIACSLAVWSIVSFCQPAQSSELRISRPADRASASSCCASEVEGQVEGQVEGTRAIVSPGSPLAHFNHWKKRFVDPVMCPIFLCHGSCGDFDDACILEKGILLNSSNGCAGSCK